MIKTIGDAFEEMTIRFTLIGFIECYALSNAVN